MPEPNQMNVSFKAGTGEPSLNSMIRESQGAARDARQRKPRLSTTLNRVVKWIEEQGFDDFTTKELIKVARSYPVGALGKFKMTARNHLVRIQEKKREMDRQNVVRKGDLDINSLKEEERRKVLEYKILRAKQKAEEDFASVQQEEEELRKLSAFRHQEEQSQSRSQPRPQTNQPKMVPRAPSGAPDLQTPRESQLATVMQQQFSSEPKAMSATGKIEFAPPPEIKKTVEENKQAMENRMAFAKRMKQLSQEEDQSDNFAMDEDWMNE